MIKPAPEPRCGLFYLISCGPPILGRGLLPVGLWQSRYQQTYRRVRILYALRLISEDAAALPSSGQRW